MNWFKKNINGILGTIIFHLLIVIVAMISKLESQYRHVENFTIIQAEFLRDFEDEKISEQEDFDDMSIEDRITELRTVASTQRGERQTLENIESMSMEEIRQRYEEMILREKYGDKYDELFEQTHEDDSPDDVQESTEYQDHHVTTQDYETYSGPALVFVDLENEDRTLAYIDVPVFRCLGGGVIELRIVINPAGRVVSSSVISITGSEKDRNCLIEQAHNAASISRFGSVSHGSNEYGTITYHFIPQ